MAKVWRTLGIDPQSTPIDTTLADIGLESMFAVELQQEFSRELNTNFTLVQLKQITIGMLKEYEQGNLTPIKSLT